MCAGLLVFCPFMLTRNAAKVMIQGRRCVRAGPTLVPVVNDAFKVVMIKWRMPQAAA